MFLNQKRYFKSLKSSGKSFYTETKKIEKNTSMVIAQMQFQVLLLKCDYKRVSIKRVLQEQLSKESHTCCSNVLCSTRLKKLLNLIIQKGR